MSGLCAAGTPQGTAMLLENARKAPTWRSHGGENQQRPLNDGLRRPFCWREGAQSTTTNDSGSYPHLVVDIRISTVPVKFSYAHAGLEVTGGSHANRAALPFILGIG